MTYVFIVLGDQKRVIATKQNDMQAAMEFVAATVESGIGGDVQSVVIVTHHEDGSMTLHAYRAGDNGLAQLLSA